MKLDREEFNRMRMVIAEMDAAYQDWRVHYRELAEFILPFRYSWLTEAPALIGGGVPVIQSRPRADSNRNKQILDATGTRASRDLAAGLFDGVTSPSRPWFNLRPVGFSADTQIPLPLARWVEEQRRRMFLVLAESNFYTSIATLFLDLVVFGTPAMLIYEDFDDVIRCYGLPVGEFRIAVDHRRQVSHLGRTFTKQVHQLVAEFGIDNCTAEVQAKWRAGGANRFQSVVVSHLIEPNVEGERFVPGGYAYREFYFESANNPTGMILRRAVYNERPFVCPRWELVGDQIYGLSPAMDALPDIIQLQHETLRKAEALDKMTDPPVVLDSTMRNHKGAVNPGTKFYAPGHSQVGARPLYTVAMPIAELSADIAGVQMRIRDAFFGDLFRMISQLETVRSATEIDARREEKLVLLGAVLGRLETEALDPLIQRVFSIMKRKGLISPPPEEFGEVELEVQYVSILSDAQRAVGTGVIERFMTVVGNVSGLVPEVKDVPNWNELIREYGTRLNVPPSGMRSPEELAALAEQAAGQQQLAQQAAMAEQLTAAGKNLGAIDVGGGQNAFAALLGG